MTAALWHCKSDSVNCSTAYRAGDPHHLRCITAAAFPTSLDHPTGGPRQTRRQSPSEGREGNRSRSGLPPTTTDASSKCPTINLLKKPRRSHSDYAAESRGPRGRPPGVALLRWSRGEGVSTAVVRHAIGTPSGSSCNDCRRRPGRWLPLCHRWS